MSLEPSLVQCSMAHVQLEVKPSVRGTRMKTFISSKAFVALLTDRRTKYLHNRCSFMRGNRKKKIGVISQLGAEKITFPPKRG